MKVELGPDLNHVNIKCQPFALFARQALPKLILIPVIVCKVDLG